MVHWMPDRVRHDNCWFELFSSRKYVSILLYMERRFGNTIVLCINRTALRVWPTGLRVVYVKSVYAKPPEQRPWVAAVPLRAFSGLCILPDALVECPRLLFIRVCGHHLLGDEDEPLL